MMSMVSTAQGFTARRVRTRFCVASKEARLSQQRELEGLEAGSSLRGQGEGGCESSAGKGA